MVKISEAADCLRRIRNVFPSAELYMAEEGLFHERLGPKQMVYHLDVKAVGQLHSVSIIDHESLVPTDVVCMHLMRKMASHLYNF